MRPLLLLCACLGLGACTAAEQDMFLDALATEINNYNQTQMGGSYASPSTRPNSGTVVDTSSGKIREFSKRHCPDGMGVTPWSKGQCVHV